MKADNLDEAMYANLNTEFNDYKKTLRRSINEAKQLYYKRTFELCFFEAIMIIHFFS